MKIQITWGVSYGIDELTSFHNALKDAGIEQYNIIKLSSVIPPGTELVIEKHAPEPNRHGWKLYGVVSHICETKPGKSACAGLGWVQDKSTGKGFFVAECAGKSKEDLNSRIAKALDFVGPRFSNMTQNSKIASIKCENKNKPVSAVVCAIYKVEDWK